MIGVLTRNRATLTRRVTVSAGRAITVDDAIDPIVFYVGLEPPRQSRSGDDSPRSAPSYTVRWNLGGLGPAGELPGAGSRLSVVGATYELLSAPKQLLYGLQPVAYEAPAQLVEVLYPFTGELREQDGTVIGPVDLALWAPNESHTDAGVYEDLTGHAPVDFISVLARNQRIVLDDGTYNVLNVNEQTTEPHATFSVRRAGG